MLLLATQTGLRASELIGLSCGDVHLRVGAHGSCLGKGRKQHITPLTKQTVTVLRAGSPSAPATSTSRCSRPAAAARSAATRSSTPRPARRDRQRSVPVASGQEDHTARAAPHRGDAAPARRRRHVGHRALARPRANRDHPDLPRRRHGTQKRQRSQGPRRRTRRRGATGHPTRCSPSSKRSDYADLTHTRPTDLQPLLARVGITRTSA
jgi:hypothetical protein